ncbi:unnamed protein product, partial [Musa textilis]
MCYVVETSSGEVWISALCDFPSSYSANEENKITNPYGSMLVENWSTDQPSESRFGLGAQSCFFQLEI